MNITQIEKNIESLIENFSKETFIYDLLRAYGLPKATITLLQKGTHNLSKQEGQIILKKKLLFQEMAEGDNLHATIDVLQNEPANQKHDPRFIILTDYKLLLAVDTKTLDTLDIAIEELPQHPHFFAPWAGMEKYQHQNENIADVKAAERMAKLYDQILKDNPEIVETKEELHKLNVFLSRLLFCFFAEDTDIFTDNAFTNSISSHTQEDGSDLDQHLNKLFEVLNTQKSDGLPSHLKDFPYVNGGLFGDSYDAPKFSRKSRQMMIDCGKLQWKDINPDIFGSMIQAVVHPDQRGGMGIHYTSVPNIMKVIEPLFLNELREEFEASFDNEKKLKKLLERLYRIKIFDPACGSGNFLIIAYKKLRELEMAIFQRVQEITNAPSLSLSCISLSQFYGIELDDFAHEVAILSLWLAEHQMNVKFKEVFGKTNPSLPLKEGGKIVWGNATRITWEKVCPKTKDAEIYILGNPPFVGDKLQSEEQKKDLALIFGKHKNSKAMDYISAWFMKASEYIDVNGGSFAFVTTNSLTQGIQVPLLWPHIFSKEQEIFFAYKSFPWTNNAKNKAAVICCIIGVRHKNKAAKYIYDGVNFSTVGHITPYLTNGINTAVVQKHPKSIFGLPLMVAGNIPRDKGHLMFSQKQKDSLIKDYPEASKLFRQIMGSKEFINGITRWCLWINDSDEKLAYSIPEIARRLDQIVEYRTNGSDRGKLGIDTPYKFERTITCKKTQIIVPRVSSQRREYIPIGFLSPETIISDAAQGIYDCETYVFSLICSRIHMVWVKVTAGRMKSDYRYSSGVCYNSFPVPELTNKQKETLTQHAFNVLDARDAHPEKTMAELYDPDKMPDDLREAHHDLDLAVERCYRSKPFTSDEERLEYLFKLYEEMTAAENKKETIL